MVAQEKDYVRVVVLMSPEMKRALEEKARKEDRRLSPQIVNMLRPLLDEKNPRNGASRSEGK